MRLAICLFKHFPHSGLSRDMLRIVNEACSRGHVVTLFAGSWEGAIPRGAELVIIKPVGITNYGRARSFHSRLAKTVAPGDFDSIIGFNKMPGLDIYYAADSCFVARAAIKHSPFYRITPRYRRYRQLEKAVFSPAAGTHILSISERENEVYRRFYLTPDQKFTALPQGLDDLPDEQARERSGRDDTRQQLGIANNELIILLVGSGFRTKGLDRAIRALASLPDELIGRTRLLVVGGDRQAPFKRLAARCGVSDRVKFLGVRDDVPALLAAGDLLLHPAYAELAGAVILEAMGAGLPVLVSHVCGNAWHVDRASAGRVLPAAFSQLELNQVLVEMLTSRARSEWAENGLTYAAGPAFRSMAASAVDAIEHLPMERTGELVPGGKTFLYVSTELAESLQGQRNFNDLWNTSGDIYRRGPGRRTLKFSAGGKDYFLKAHSGVGWREILKNLLYLRLPVVGARNEWDGIHRLRQLGIDTLTPSAYGGCGRNPATRKSFIITQALPTVVTLEDYCADWGGGPASGERLRVKRWLIVRLAHIARTLHCSGANHRDFYLCHFMMSLPEEGGRAQLEAGRIYLIDLHRMQLRRNTPSRWVVKDIAGLYFSAMDTGLTARDCYLFMKHYSGGRGLREILRDESSFWRRVENRATGMYRRQQKDLADAADPVAPGAL